MSSSLKRSLSKKAPAVGAKLSSSKLGFKPSDVPSDPEDPILNDFSDDDEEPKKKKTKVEGAKVKERSREPSVDRHPEVDMTCKEELPPTLHTTASVAPAAVAAEVLTEVLFDKYSDKNFADKVQSEIERLLPKVNSGLARAKLPDTAMALWSMNSGCNISFLEHVCDLSKKIYAKRTKPTDAKPAAYTNVMPLRMRQRFIPSFNRLMINFCMLSPACQTAFLDLGYSADKVEGNRGRKIKDGTVEDRQSKYTFDLSNESYNDFIKDSELMNPMAQLAFNQHIALEKTILGKFFDVRDCMTDQESEWKKKSKKSKDFVMPSTREEKVEAADTFHSKVKSGRKDDPDDASRNMEMSASVFRSVQIDKNGESEDLTGYKPPSELFESVTHNKEGKRLVHNDIPVFACRRAEDVDDEVEYEAPFFQIPKENVELDWKRDVVFVLYSIGFYEWKMGGPGVMNVPLAIIWLNTKQALQDIRMQDVKACDPRKAIPMAGVYEGPLERAKKLAAAGPVATATVNEAGNEQIDFVSNA